MMGFVQPIGKARLRKSGVAGEAADPVAMQKGVEMFGRSALFADDLDWRSIPSYGQLTLEEGEDHLAAGLQCAKGVGGVDIGFARIEMGKDRLVKNHVQRRVGRYDRGRKIEQHVIAGASADQFLDLFLHDIRAGIISLSAMANQSLRRAAAPRSLGRKPSCHRSAHDGAGPRHGRRRSTQNQLWSARRLPWPELAPGRREIV